MGLYRRDADDTVLNHRELQNHLGISFPPARPPQGWSAYDPGPAAFTPEQMRVRQQAQVRQAAEIAYLTPVTDANGVTWNGGFDSASKITGAADMAEFAGQTHITIYDLDNVEHVVTLTGAKQVAATLGAVFQQQLAAKQAALRALAAIDLEAPDARERIEAVTFDDFYPGG